jgi:TolA-binding protein
MRTLISLAVVSLVSLAFSRPVSAQADLMQAGETVDEGYLQFDNPVVAIWPEISREGIDAYEQIIDQLIAVYEAELQTADAHESELKALIDEAKKNEDIVKAKIDLAKKVENEEERKRLEDLKKSHETRRKYIEDIRKIREQERKASEARVEYFQKLEETLETTKALAEVRGASDAGVDDLLRVEEELIKQSQELSKLNDKVAGESNKLSKARMSAFKERTKILELKDKADS